MSLAVHATVAPAPETLQIGDWSVERDLDQLRSAGRTVKLEPKAMAVLLHLASRPGQVLSREALLDAVWPGVVVGDDSLTQVIIKLRKALGDDPERPAYIQTVTKKGYRLIAPVRRGFPQIAAEPTRHKTGWMAGGIALALLVAIGSWWWIESRHATGVSQGAKVLPDLSQLPTVAIAPFEALSKDAQERLLARGITADLLADLSKAAGLSVIGFSPMDGRNAAESHAESRYLVSGTVQRIDERLRLQVFLTEQATGRQVWSERFDRSVSDLFSIQDELGPKIVRLLPAKINEAELRRMARRHTRNLQAYEYFQRGQAALLVRRKSGNDDARRLFQRAIDLDATFARAYSGLALTYAADYRNRWASDGSRALEHAFQLARTANEINPDVPETYWALAYVHAQRREHAQALQYLEKSVSLYPSFSDGYALMASVKTFAGQPADAIPLMRTAMRLNPTSGYLYFLVLGRAYFFVGDFEQARINLDQALKRNPEYLETHLYAAALRIDAGDRPAATWEADQIRALEPAFSAQRWLDSYPMTDSVQRTKLLQALQALSL
jgi:DNA-binding winged helix-turn-helix (wHTH) protein/TolB-like protein/Flp pilus assembly protein TadD